MRGRETAKGSLTHSLQFNLGRFAALTGRGDSGEKGEARSANRSPRIGSRTVSRSSSVNGGNNQKYRQKPALGEPTSEGRLGGAPAPVDPSPMVGTYRTEGSGFKLVRRVLNLTAKS